MDQERRVATQSALSIVVRTAGLLLSFFTLGIVTRYLGPERAGEYFTVLAYAAIFGVLADLGLYQALLREISKPGADEARVVSSFLSLRLASLVSILGIASPLMALFLPYTTAVKMGILIGSAIFICLSLTTFFIAVFQKKTRMQAVAYGEFIGRIMLFALVFLFLRRGGGVYAALFAMLAAAATHLAIVAWFARRHVPYYLTANIAEWRGIVRVSYPIALSAIFSFVYFKIDTLLLAYFKPVADVGMYGLAYKLLETLVAYPPIYIGLLVPFFVRYAATDREKFRAVLQKALDVLSFIAFPMLFGGIMLAPRIIPLFGAGYDGAAPALQVLLGATFAIFYGALFSNILIATHRQKTLAHIYFLGMALNVAANLYAIPRWSYMGAAWVTLLTEASVTVAMALALRHQQLLGISLSHAARAALAALAMAVVLVLLAAQPLVALLAAGAVSYAFFALVVRVISVTDIKNILKPVQ